MIILRKWQVLKNYLFELLWCARHMGNPFNAYGYLRKGLAPKIGLFNFQGFMVQARKEDWKAIREVLIDDEYLCIDQLFSTNESPRVLDLGANVGCFAIRMFQHCNTSQVVSVEAADDTFQVLRENQLLNPCLDWKVMNFGVWSEDVPLTLMRRGISISHRVVKGGGSDAVNGISIQSLVNKIGWSHIDLIKIDIEGGEETVIPAAVDILKITRFIIIEIHNDRIDPEPVISSLKSVFSYHWQLNDRTSSKPVYVMSNESLALGSQIIL